MEDALGQDALPGGYEESPEFVYEWATVAPQWRRGAAFLLDASLLLGIGFILGHLLKDLFVPLGNWGKLVGLVIAALYFVPLDGGRGGGQTLGKRLFGVRVVGGRGGAVDATDGVMASNVAWGGYVKDEGRYMRVTAYLDEKPRSFDEALDRVALAVLKVYPHVDEAGQLTVTAVYCYDIGIYWSYYSRGVSIPPEAWRRRLGLEAR